MKKRIISEVVAEPPAGTFSNAFFVSVPYGGTMYISGQTAALPDGSIVGDADVRAQTTEVFLRIKSLLSEAGLSMNHVVKLTTYLTDMSDRSAFSETRATFFSGDFPASTLVEVSALALPGLLVEVEAIAVT